jgi:hypothetical protein
MAAGTPLLHPINLQHTHGQSIKKTGSQEAFNVSITFPQHKPTFAKEVAPPHTTSTEISLFLPYSKKPTIRVPLIQLREGEESNPHYKSL